MALKSSLYLFCVIKDKSGYRVEEELQMTCYLVLSSHTTWRGGGLYLIIINYMADRCVVLVCPNNYSGLKVLRKGGGTSKEFLLREKENFFLNFHLTKFLLMPLDKTMLHSHLLGGSVLGKGCLAQGVTDRAGDAQAVPQRGF